MTSMKEKMHTGELYLPNDKEILDDQFQRLDRLYDYNMTRPTEGAKREALLKEMLAEMGEGCYIEPPFHANFGGGHVHLGNMSMLTLILPWWTTPISMWEIIR